MRPLFDPKRDGYLWVPKHTRTEGTEWVTEAVRAVQCPDQRKYRRLTYAERALYERLSK